MGQKMTTKEPDFDLEEAAQEYSYELYPVGHGLVTAVRSRFSAKEGFKAGFLKAQSMHALKAHSMHALKEDYADDKCPQCGEGIIIIKWSGIKCSKCDYWR